MHTIGVLGATGSIGTQALDLVAAHPDRFHVTVLTAHRSAEALFELVRRFRPKVAGLVIEPASVPEDVRRGTEWFFGPDCSERALLACPPDDALAAVVGIAGLPAVMTALGACKRVLLANKEALVAGGELVMGESDRLGVPILPVDSEHSAIFQCLEGSAGNAPRRLILTASGGPFRTWLKARIEAATIEDALGHPTWRMGSKITVDCATMMNKGLELIEAHHLFRVPEEDIDIVVHPESTIHSMVEYQDGSVLAQMGAPDMRAAIGYAMGYPNRVAFDGKRLDFARLGSLSFEAPDEDRFPCLRLARAAIRAGGHMPVTMNAANEAAVGAFLGGRIPFPGIAQVVDHVMQRAQVQPVQSIEAVLEADARAKALADERIRAL